MVVELNIKTLLPCNVFRDKILKNIELSGETLDNVCRLEKVSLALIISYLVFIVFISLLYNYLYLVFLTVEPILYSIPYIYSIVSAKEHLLRLNQEAPFFAIDLLLSSVVGRSIIKTLETASDIPLFKEIKKEVQQIRKYGVANGVSSISALEKRGIIISQTELGKLFIGYSSLAKVGLSLQQYVKDTTKSLISNLSESLNDYIEKLSQIVEAVFILYLMLPTVLIGFSFTFTPNYSVLLILLVLAVPIYYFIVSSQPIEIYSIRSSLRDFIFIPVAFMTFVVLPLSLVDRLYISTLIILGSFVPKYLEVRQIEKSIIEIKQLLYKIRDNYTLGHSIKTMIMNTRASTPFLRKVLNEIKRGIMETGRIPVVNSPSPLINFWIFALSQLDEFGGRNEEALGNLYEIYNSYMSMVDRAKAKLRMFEVLSLISPLILFYSISTLTSVSVQSTYSLLYAFAYLYSVTLSILFTRASRFTVFHIPLIFVTSTLSFLMAQYFQDSLPSL